MKLKNYFSNTIKFLVTALLVTALYSLAVSAKAVGGTEPPSVPQNVIVTGNSDSTVTLSWHFSIDNSPDPITYSVYANGSAGGSTTTTVFTVKNLLPATSYIFTVSATDAAGNTSMLSNPITVSTTEDHVSPVVQIISPTINGSISGNVTFNASSSDDVLLTGVQFTLDSVNAGPFITTAPFTIALSSNNFKQGSSHTVGVLAYDSSGNIGTARVNFSAGNPSAPIPFAVQTTQITSNSAVIIWQTNSGSTGTVEYGINGSYTLQAKEPANTTSHYVSLTGLQSLQTYNYIILSNGTGYSTATSSAVSFITLDQSAAVVPAGTAQTHHPDGTLVLDGATVYVIQNGMRAAFRDPAEYKSYGYNFSQAVPINDQDRALPAAPIMKAMEGTLVVDKADNKTVYMVGIGGSKRGFGSEQVFKGLGYVFKDLAAVNMGDYTTGSVISSAQQAHPEGSLVLDNKTVWWIRGNLRQAFESATVFNTYGFSFSKIVPANAADLALSQGSAIKFRDGTLVQDGGTYYIISDGKKFSFSDTAHLISAGYTIANAISGSVSNYEMGGQAY